LDVLGVEVFVVDDEVGPVGLAFVGGEDFG
jgi:hypothetical protein